jgi:parvulin-like peptidyl-prolyl isomerase
MRKFGIFFIVVIVLSTYAKIYPQKSDETLARIGNEKITVDEFRKRFELMPHVGLNAGNADSMKFQFLCTLIAEKLWGLEGENKGFDSTDIMRYSFRELEKMHLRDALYRELIENKIEIPQEDLIKGIFRMGVKLYVNVMTSRDSADIFSAFNSLNRGASFDSLLKTRPEFDGQDTAGMEVTFGRMEENIEDTLYKLLPGFYSAPVKNNGAWFIFYLRDRKQEIADLSNQNKQMNEVKKIVKDRKAQILYGKFYDRFFVGKRVDADKLLIYRIIDNSVNCIQKRRKDPDAKKMENIYLTVDDLQAMENSFGPDTLKMVIFKVNEKAITVKDLLQNLMFEGFYTNRFEPNIIAAKLNARIKNYIEHEMLTDEAFSKGLQNLPEVKQDINMWKSSYVGQILKFKYKDSLNISDKELYNYYLEKQKINNNIVQVNIQEILTDSLEIIETVLNQLKAGKDFGELARKYTKRTWTRDKGGEFGFFPSTVYGELGAAAEKMNKGEVYGPIKLPEGYSVFKLLDKKMENDSVKKSFEEAKNDLKKEYFAKKFQERLVKETVGLADKYSVSIDPKVYKDMKVENMNMYTFRYMGFGGRINAVPLPNPLYEWYGEYKKHKQDLP